MAETLSFALLCFTSFLTMINPLGVMPIYTALTAGFDPVTSRRIALKAVVTSFVILVIFAFTGQLIFRFFAISVDSLKIVGGVLFFIMGYDMLQARLTRMQRQADESLEAYAGDIAVTPLAIPMICGPGVITAVIVLMQDAATFLDRGVLLGVLLGVLTLTYVVLVGGGRIMAVLGEDGNRVLMKIMGLIVMVIAVEFFFGGLAPKVRGIMAG